MKSGENRYKIGEIEGKWKMGSKENRGKPNEKIQLFTQATALEDPRGPFESPEFCGLYLREKFEKDTLQLTQSTVG